MVKTAKIISCSGSKLRNVGFAEKSCKIKKQLRYLKQDSYRESAVTYEAEAYQEAKSGELRASTDKKHKKFSPRSTQRNAKKKPLRALSVLRG
jgi:hypothetical protein